MYCVHLGTPVCQQVSEKRIAITNRECHQPYCTNLVRNRTGEFTYSLIGTKEQLASFNPRTVDHIGLKLYLKVPDQAVIRFENRQSLFVQ
jgi:hypothetical protein